MADRLVAAAPPRIQDLDLRKLALDKAIGASNGDRPAEIVEAAALFEQYLREGKPDK